MTASGARAAGAIVLAAGLGTRLRPLTADLPKPLLKVAGRALIDHALDRLAEAGIGLAVVNLHYKGELLRAHLRRRARPQILFSDEGERLLETGGGVGKALPLLARRFFAVNGDVIWRGSNPFFRLEGAWEDTLMDALLLLQPRDRALGYTGQGDFAIEPAPMGRLRRRQNGAPFVFTGIQLLSARLFDRAPEGAFSLNLLYDRAISSGRLFGLVHAGEWADAGSPDGLKAAERLFHGKD
jgi:MurNAc alpha-1-phosphate uridylyltransferase